MYGLCANLTAVSQGGSPQHCWLGPDTAFALSDLALAPLTPSFRQSSNQQCELGLQVKRYSSAPSALRFSSETLEPPSIFARHPLAYQHPTPAKWGDRGAGGKETNGRVKTRAKDSNRHFSKQDKQMAYGHTEKKKPTHSASLIIREIRFKTTGRCHLLPRNRALTCCRGVRNRRCP